MQEPGLGKKKKKKKNLDNLTSSFHKLLRVHLRIPHPRVAQRTRKPKLRSSGKSRGAETRLEIQSVGNVRVRPHAPDDGSVPRLRVHIKNG